MVGQIEEQTEVIESLPSAEDLLRAVSLEKLDLSQKTEFLIVGADLGMWAVMDDDDAFGLGSRLVQVVKY